MRFQTSKHLYQITEGSVTLCEMAEGSWYFVYSNWKTGEDKSSGVIVRDGQWNDEVLDLWLAEITDSEDRKREMRHELRLAVLKHGRD